MRAERINLRFRTSISELVLKVQLGTCNRYLNYSIQQLKQLQAHDITPILVFDGAPLPAKAQENAARSRLDILSTGENVSTAH